jgi:hypothetical protein
MLIEAAFYKLPELLISNFAHADTYEGTLVNCFSMSILMELNGRNTPNPYEHLHTEKPYPTTGEGQRRWRADLCLNLQGAIRLDGRMALYGVRELNWIEIKGFFESTRGSSDPPKTIQAGRILRDLIRLALLPEELQGKIRQNGRYMLVVFANRPQASLPIGSANNERSWLRDLFTEGTSSLKIDLLQEPDSLRRAIGPGFFAVPSLQLHMEVHTHSFEPDGLIPSPVFFGYLLKLRSFKVTTPIAEVTYDDTPDDAWGADRIKQIREVRGYVLTKMRGDEDA